MSAEKFIEIQNQMRQNTSELKDYLAELDDWSTKVKVKEEKLKTESSPGKPNELPPVRNSLDKKVRKKKKKKSKELKTVEQKSAEKKRIDAYDFRAWDKFDVDKACEEIDSQSNEPKVEGSSSEYETDEEWEELRMKQQATLMKDQGNQYFKEGKFEEAIECYTRGINCDASNALLPANRAMALLKQEKFAAAELDCTLAISLDLTYIKAYQRRGTARFALKKLKEAKEDFQFVLQKEPNNKLALGELDKIEKIVNAPQFSVSTEGEVGIVKPIHKPPNQRSKKPLKRVAIEIIGEENEAEKSKKFAAKAPAVQSSAARKLVSEDQEYFEKFTKKGSASCEVASVISSPADIATFQGVPDGQTSSPIENPSESKDTPTTETETPEESKKARNSNAQEGRHQQLQIPATSYQFLADYKQMKNTPEIFFAYFKEIDPKNYPKLFGQFLDAEMLMTILTNLQDFYVPSNLDIFSVLKNLTAVRRFDMTAMFMSKSEKEIVQKLFSHIKSSTNLDDSELSKVMKAYTL